MTRPVLLAGFRVAPRCCSQPQKGVNPGRAGWLVPLTLKGKRPHLQVGGLRSPDIGIMGVGEGTTAVFPRHFFEYLKLKPGEFYATAEPTWKLGIKFLWGPRPYFYYSFCTSSCLICVVM